MLGATPRALPTERKRLLVASSWGAGWLGFTTLLDLGFQAAGALGFSVQLPASASGVWCLRLLRGLGHRASVRDILA